MLNFDIFGDVREPPEPEKETRAYKTMQQQNRYTEGKICKTCRHHKIYNYHDKNYHKCLLWIVSHSAATDIRVNAKACGKWEGKNEAK